MRGENVFAKMVVRAERGEEAILRWWCSQPGTSAVRRDMSVRRACETKGEVLEVFEEEDEHHVQQGLYSLPCAGTHSLENHPGKTKRGAVALEQLKAFEGIPALYD